MLRILPNAVELPASCSYSDVQLYHGLTDRFAVFENSVNRFMHASCHFASMLSPRHHSVLNTAQVYLNSAQVSCILLDFGNGNGNMILLIK